MSLPLIFPLVKSKFTISNYFLLMSGHDASIEWLNPHHILNIKYFCCHRLLKKRTTSIYF